MKTKFRLLITLNFLAITFSIGSATAQEPVKEPITQPDLQVILIGPQTYDDAYDAYLRKLERKHRTAFELKSGLALTQTSFSNWTAGGNNSYSGRSFINLTHKYTAPRYSLETIFDTAYGLISTDGTVKKSEDYFNISTSPSWRLSPHWELTASVILRSQYSNSYSYQKVGDVETKTFTSTLFAPAYLTLAPGFKYSNTAQTVDFVFAPTAGNLIMVLDQKIADLGTFGKVGKKYNPQFINYLKFNYKEKFDGGKLSFNMKFESFWHYGHSTPRIVSENKIEYQISSLFKANLYILGIYDDTMASKRLQMTETFGFGIGYNFVSKKHPAPNESPRKGYKRGH